VGGRDGCNVQELLVIGYDCRLFDFSARQIRRCLQLRFDFDSTAVRLSFDVESQSNGSRTGVVRRRI